MTSQKTTHENTRWFGAPTVCESPYPTEHSQEWSSQSTQEERETGNRAEKAKAKVFGNKKQDNESSHRQAFGNKGRVAAKTYMKEFAGTARASNASLFGKVYQYLQKKLDVTGSSIEELG